MTRYIQKHLTLLGCLCISMAACSTDNDSNNQDELLELVSLSDKCLSDAFDLEDFNDSAVVLKTDAKGVQTIEYPAMWYPGVTAAEIEYSYSKDTLNVKLFKKMESAPGTVCPRMVKAEIHGDLNASYLQSSGHVFKL